MNVENENLNKLPADDVSNLKNDEIKILVSNYYRMQSHRIRLDAQIRSFNKDEEKKLIVTKLLENTANVFRKEEDINSNIIKKWVSHHKIASICTHTLGIGHILAAGLVSHVDWSMIGSAGRLWAYCGLNPEAKWEKGCRCPWNSTLKQLCFLMGESFVKQKNREKDIYGKIYQKRKDWETLLNNAIIMCTPDGKKLFEKLENTSKEKEIELLYGKMKKYGYLRPAALHSRAKRYAVKLYLADCVRDLHKVKILTKNPNDLFPMTGKMYLEKEVDTFKIIKKGRDNYIETIKGLIPLNVWFNKYKKFRKIEVPVK